MKKLLPPNYFLMLLCLSIVVHFLFPISKIIHPPYNWFGVLPIFFGVVINLWTDNLFKKEKTTVKPGEKPSSLVVSGPFRVSRHPMYLGMTAILLGVSTLLGSISSFVFPFVFVILMEKLFIPLEEEYMKKIFGQRYLNYKKKAWRWF
jgi:protein-S-isoprenylcysteine O-methyltransferase Ste14